jgi:putative ABC transport system permease protein
VRDYVFAAGEPLTDPDLDGRRMVTVVGFDVADKLFGDAEKAVGRKVRVSGKEFVIKGVIAKKGKVLGQSFDGFLLLPYSTFESMYGRRKTTVVSVKMRDAEQVEPGMARAQEAMRVAHRLRPTEPDDFTVDKADALVAFWKSLTRILFTIIPAVVCIGIVIMNIMLMTVNERTREIGIRKSLGATRRDIRRQFLVEAATLSFFGGILGVAAGWSLALLVSAATPLPARVTAWSVSVALALGAGTGLLFGVYPATRAARLDPITALRAE